MFVWIKGAGDLASGIALRLHHARIDVVMTDLAVPTAVRRTVSFCEAIRLGETYVEDTRGVLAQSAEDILKILESGDIPVLADPEGRVVRPLHPNAVVDAVIAKRNTGTRKSDAPVVIGVGPGFTAGSDCHAVIETKRGHCLGRVIREGCAIPNTGIPGEVGGYTSERVLRAPCAGIFHAETTFGDLVRAGDRVARIDDTTLTCEIDGMIRGMLADGIPVTKGFKCGDVDPRGRAADYTTVSDKALAIAGGVLEALLMLGARNW